MDFLTVLSGAGSVAWTVLFFLISIAIIVAVHEYGHYIVGRWSGIHAEVFSLGFGPVVFSRTDRRGTRWQLAAVPLGGYVKFMGDADAASGRDEGAMGALSAEERRHTMHGAPLWARAATVAAGPLFNLILTLVVFIGMIGVVGVATDRPVVGELRTVPFAAQGLQVGDLVLAVNGIETPDMTAYVAMASKLPAAPSVEYRVERGGADITLQGPHPYPPVVVQVHSKNAAMAAGMQAGDVIISANGKPIWAFAELPPIVEAAAGKPVALVIWRGGQEIMMSLKANRRDLPLAEGGFETRWLVGLSGGLLFEPEVRRAGPLETVQLAFAQTWFVAKTSLSGLWHVVTGAISSCNLSGPIGMAEVMGDAARSGPEVFFSMLAVLSLGIGMLNLFPIPVLDGGHLVFHAFEAVTGRPPSGRVLQVLMTAGLVLILGFMAFAVSNDLFCA